MTFETNKEFFSTHSHAGMAKVINVVLIRGDREKAGVGLKLERFEIDPRSSFIHPRRFICGRRDSLNGQLFVTDVVPGGPAAESGIKVMALLVLWHPSHTQCPPPPPSFMRLTGNITNLVTPTAAAVSATKPKNDVQIDIHDATTAAAPFHARTGGGRAGIPTARGRRGTCWSRWRTARCTASPSATPPASSPAPRSPASPPLRVHHVPITSPYVNHVPVTSLSNHCRVPITSLQRRSLSTERARIASAHHSPPHTTLITFPFMPSHVPVTSPSRPRHIPSRPVSP